jgi:DNA-binding MarR family transcriptional regulator
MSDPDLSSALRLVFLKLRRNILSKFQEAGVPLNPPDAHILEMLEIEPGLSPQDLTRLSGIDKAYITRRVRELETHGLICRCRDEQDQRRFRLYLNPNGLLAMTRAQELIHLCEEDMFAPLDPANRQALAMLLGKCLKKTDAPLQ